MFDTALTSADLVFLAKGAGMTLLVTAISVVLGTILGVIFGVFRTQVGPVWAAPLGANADKYPLQDYLDRVEKAVILEALEKTRFNRTQAARILGVTFRSMRYRLERLGIQ